jgi:hypothetical protein
MRSNIDTSRGVRGSTLCQRKKIHEIFPVDVEESDDDFDDDAVSVISVFTIILYLLLLIFVDVFIKTG